MNDIMWALGEIPMGHVAREQFIVSDLVAYHVTRAINVDSILASGLRAQTCVQSYERPAAVYLFADRGDITHEVLGILGMDADYVVVEVRIPRQAAIDSLRWDGLFNVSFGLTYSAVQYMGNIPAEWIVGIVNG